MKIYCRYIISILFLFLLHSPLVNAQEISINSKQISSVNYDRLKRIDTLVNDYISKNWLKGAVTLVVKDNQLVQYKGYGYLNEETKKELPKDAIFRIMSQTKAITSTGIMILFE